MLGHARGDVRVRGYGRYAGVSVEGWIGLDWIHLASAASIDLLVDAAFEFVAIIRGARVEVFAIHWLPESTATRPTNL